LEIKDLILGFLLGLAVGWIISQHSTARLRKTYSNVEEWEIIKDEKGRVRGIKVHRTAEEV